MTKAQIARERLSPWVTFLPAGATFTIAQAQDACHQIEHGPKVRIDSEQIRQVLNRLVGEGFLAKNQQGRKISYTRVEVV